MENNKRRRIDKVIKDREFPFDIFDGREKEWEPGIDESLCLHCHSCLELNYVDHGEGYNLFEDGKYDLHPGELFLINNQEYHHAVNTDDLVLKVIVFDSDLVWQNNQFDYLYLKTFFEWGSPAIRHVGKDSIYINRVRKIIYTIEREWNEKRSGYQIMIKSLLLELLALIYRSASEESGFREETRTFDKNYEKLKKAVEYISLHFSENLNLNSLAKMVYLSPNYFSVIFKETMHMTLFNYIQKIRVQNACQILKTTDTGIAEIAVSCGFNSVSYFNKIFREWMDCSPGEYRKHFRK